MRFLLSRHLAQFVAIYDKGSLRAASEVLNVSQPALSKSLSQFEMLLDVKLFDRTGGRLNPTPFADILRTKANIILKEAEITTREIEKIKQNYYKPLTGSAGPVWLSEILPDVLPSLYHQFPGLNIGIKLESADVAIPKYSMVILTCIWLDPRRGSCSRTQRHSAVKSRKHAVRPPLTSYPCPARERTRNVPVRLSLVCIRDLGRCDKHFHERESATQRHSFFRLHLRYRIFTWPCPYRPANRPYHYVCGCSVRNLCTVRFNSCRGNFTESDVLVRHGMPHQSDRFRTGELSAGSVENPI